MIRAFDTIILLLFVYILSGCVFVPQNQSALDVSQISNRARDCKKLSVKFFFSGFYDVGYEPSFADLKKNQRSDPNFDDSYFDYKITLKKSFESANFFYISDENATDYYLVFGLEQTDYNWGVAWITALTYGLIPTYHSGKYQASLKVFSKDGNEIAVFKANELHFKRYMGFLILPFVFKNSEDQSEVLKKYINAASTQLLNDFSQSKFYLEAAKCN